jgi:hypothetical protein
MHDAHFTTRLPSTSLQLDASNSNRAQGVSEQSNRISSHATVRLKLQFWCSFAWAAKLTSTSGNLPPWSEKQRPQQTSENPVSEAQASTDNPVLIPDIGGDGFVNNTLAGQAFKPFPLTGTHGQLEDSSQLSESPTSKLITKTPVSTEARRVCSFVFQSRERTAIERDRLEGTDRFAKNPDSF